METMENACKKVAIIVSLVIEKSKNLEIGTLILTLNQLRDGECTDKSLTSKAIIKEQA